jgi:hypothetical protein
MSVIFTARRDESQYLYALVLAVNSSSPTEFRDGGFEDIQDLKERVCHHYGDDAVFMPPSKFQSELAQRQVHTPELVALLGQNGELLGQDITLYIVYGSPMRPMSGIWARIDGAVFIQSDKQQSGYHTYVAVPQLLDAEVTEQYELEFVSRPQSA